MNLKGLSYAGLSVALCEIATQGQIRKIFRSLHRDAVDSIDAIDVTRRVRERLSGAECPSLIPEVVPSGDQSRKMVFRSEEGAFESVLIPHPRRTTVCVSSQMGCALDCSFCVTGLIPLRRNLLAWEIVEQIQWARRLSDGRIPTNVVFMGMGEPLLNFDEVRSAVEIVCDSNGMGIARSKVTVSTAGYVPNILRWGREVGTNLAVSVIAATDRKRSELMSINRRFPLDELTDAIREYTRITGRRVLCEYLLIDGYTDGFDDAKALAERFSGMDVTINLIPYNENPARPYRRPAVDRVEAFKRAMVEAGLFTTVRWSHGGDIGAACGQLSATREARS